MRARTKTATVWMVMVAGERKSCWDNPQAARAARDAHNNHRPHLLHGATISKVTRYRLAPLIELPTWINLGNERFVAHPRGDDDGHGAREVEAHVWFAASLSKHWRAAVNQEEDTGHESREAAFAACEERLRELGYKVAKAVPRG